MKIKDCSTPLEVQTEIERIDEKIISLLAERSAYVELAKQFKSAPQEANFVLHRHWATKNQLDADFVEELFEKITIFLRQQKNEGQMCKASNSDLKEMLLLQKLAYITEAEINNDYTIPPLMQTISDLEKEMENYTFLKYVVDNEIIGSVRAKQIEGTCYINKLVVHPLFQNQGVGKLLMKAIEREFGNARRYELFTSQKSIKNMVFYGRLGYQFLRTENLNESIEFVYFEKVRPK